MLAFRVGASFSGNYMLCKDVHEVCETLHGELCPAGADLKCMAEEGEHYFVQPVEMTEEEFKKIYHQEFPGW